MPGDGVFVPPLVLCIIKVRDLPDMDAGETTLPDNITDPYVKIRFKEIRTGKVLFAFFTACFVIITHI